MRQTFQYRHTLLAIADFTLARGGKNAKMWQICVAFRSAFVWPIDKISSWLGKMPGTMEE